MQFLLELFADLLLCFEDLKFSKKERRTRKLREIKGLPPGPIKMVPSAYYRICVGAVVVVFIIILFVLKVRYHDPAKAKEALSDIEELLAAEYTYSGVYPEKLTAVIRNNPLRANIHIDFWDNEYFYEPLNGGKGYLLICKGKDGVLNTEDDLKRAQN